MQKISTSLARFVHTLGTEYERELITESSIAPEVAMERGYLALGRPRVNADNSPVVGIDSREFLRKIGFPGWAVRDDYMYPGLWIPGWDVNGRRQPGQWKPRNPVPGPNGKHMKYAGAKGQPSRLDVHPRWTRDPDPDGRSDAPPAIRDISVPLWVTEGVKKADALTSRNVCTIALSGVFNWRNGLGELGDWESVPLKGREVTICFDADARHKPQVAQAMERLGRWLKSRGAGRVWYCVVPGEIVTSSGVTPVKGVDDYLAAGGSLSKLEQGREHKPPQCRSTSDTYTDARLAETIALEVLDGRYLYTPAAKGGTWRAWTGLRWAEVHEVAVQEAVRQWALDRHAEAAQALRDGADGAAEMIDGFRTMLGAARQRAVLGLARGIDSVIKPDDAFDADPDLLNTPTGVVDLRTREIMPHSPDYLMTRITLAGYRPGATHPAWDKALQAIAPDAVQWLQARIGQAATGHQADDGRMVLFTGGGDNGKTLFMGAIFRALGGGESSSAGYATKVPNTLLLKGGQKGAATPEKMTLRATRLAYIEETPEEAYLDSNMIKEILDAERIDGRELYKGTSSFTPTHSLFLNTNHPPIVSDTGHGSWRRLSRVPFPYTWLPPSKPITDPATQRHGDPTLKRALRETRAQEAVLAWIVDGAHAWYGADQVLTKDDPASVVASLADWRMRSDVILRFLTERCEFHPARYVSSVELFTEFDAWLTANRHKPMSATTFKAKLSEHTGLPGAVTFGKKRFSGAGFSPVPGRTDWLGKPPPAQGVAAVGLAWKTPEA